MVINIKPDGTVEICGMKGFKERVVIPPSVPWEAFSSDTYNLLLSRSYSNDGACPACAPGRTWGTLGLMKDKWLIGKDGKVSVSTSLSSYLIVKSITCNECSFRAVRFRIGEKVYVFSPTSKAVLVW